LYLCQLNLFNKKIMELEKKRKLRRIITESDDEEDKVAITVVMKQVKKSHEQEIVPFCLESHWTSCLLGPVSLNSKGRPRIHLYTREHETKNSFAAKKALKSDLHFTFVIGDGAIAEESPTLVSISDFDEDLMKLTKFMINPAHLPLARVIIHWVFLFLKIINPRAMSWEFDLRERADCHADATPTFWRKTFRKEFDLFVAAGISNCTRSITDAEDMFKTQLAIVGATRIE